MAFDGEVKFVGSGHDVVRRIVYSNYLPKERAGYILAKYALASFSARGLNGPYEEYAELAMHRLVDEPTAAEHQPPVSDELKELTQEFFTESENWSRPDGLLLLAWAVDDGERS